MGKAPATPDLIEPVIGFRVWKLLDGKLYSPLQTHCWVPGANTAYCRRGGTPPSCHSACGLYAQHQVKSLGPELRAVGVIGAVQAWGVLETHSMGFRAEHARPILLTYSPYASARQHQRLRETARYYQLEVVAEAELEARAAGYGTQVGSASPLHSW